MSAIIMSADVSLYRKTILRRREQQVFQVLRRAVKLPMEPPFVEKLPATVVDESVA